MRTNSASQPFPPTLRTLRLAAVCFKKACSFCSAAPSALSARITNCTGARERVLAPGPHGRR